MKPRQTKILFYFIIGICVFICIFFYIATQTASHIYTSTTSTATTYTASYTSNSGSQRKGSLSIGEKEKEIEALKEWLNRGSSIKKDVSHTAEVVGSGDHRDREEIRKQLEHEKELRLRIQKEFESLKATLYSYNSSSSTTSSTITSSTTTSTTTTSNMEDDSEEEEEDKPCHPHLSLNTHFANREFWHAITPEQFHQHHSSIQDFIKNTLPQFSYTSFKHYHHSQLLQPNPNPNNNNDKDTNTEYTKESIEIFLEKTNLDRGIIYTASGKTLDRCLASIRILKYLRNVIPIEVWYIGGELTDEQLGVLKEEGVFAKDILVEQEKVSHLPLFNTFKIQHNYGPHRNYHIKTLTLLLSPFRHILYLDSDNYPLHNPLKLFQLKRYSRYGVMFWPDFWKFPGDQPVWQLTGLECFDEMEQESGQLLLDKYKTLKPLLLSLYFQYHHHFYFKLLLGDKDTFRLSFKILGMKYVMEKRKVAIGGRVRDGRFCGHSMMQFVEGELWFIHTTAMKSTNALKEGNTWESIQYLEETHKEVIGGSSEGVEGVRVAYPVAVEYSGGIEKQKEHGGVGMETLPNPCIQYSTHSLTLPHNSKLESFRIITEDFKLYSEGRYKWFEELYYGSGGVGSRGDRTCGGGYRGNGKCMSEECCSGWGWCGMTVDHCGVGCLGGPCFHSRRRPDGAGGGLGSEGVGGGSTGGVEWCGGGRVGYGLCEGGECCSKYGWCGLSKEFCGKSNCVSGPCLSD